MRGTVVLIVYAHHMDFGISGKTAMVAAGTKGIGLAVAKELLAEGCTVHICGRHEPENLPEGLSFMACDVQKADDIERWFSATGGSDIVVTNTGGPPAGFWQDMTDEQWQSGVDSTLMSAVRMSRLAAPRMRAQGWGRIVHLTSLVALEPSQLLPISATLRTGLMSLTRVQATELAPYGVTVNSVLPGHTLTDRQRHLAEVTAQKQGISVDEAMRVRAESIPVGRLGQPEEIAAAVAFLCSVRSSFVTGTNLLVDGGSVHGLA